MKPRILIIAPESDLRRSLEFALIAEGYDVTWWSGIAPRTSTGRFNCVVLDHHATGKDSDAAIAFCQSFAPVILLANSVPHALSPWAFRTVLKPMLGPALTTAIRDALDVQSVPK